MSSLLTALLAALAVGGGLVGVGYAVQELRQRQQALPPPPPSPPEPPPADPFGGPGQSQTQQDIYNIGQGILGLVLGFGNIIERQQQQAGEAP